MNFNIQDEYLEVESCLYILHYGSKYIIVKGKTLAGSIYLIQKGYAGFLAGGKLAEQGKGHKEWEGKNSFYFKFYKHVKENPKLTWSIEIILESENGYQLLMMEQITLQLNIRDKNCLNSNVTSYIPQYREKTKSYGWISKAHVLNFQKFLKKPVPVDINSK